jgi:thiamine pyrophosphokinase
MFNAMMEQKEAEKYLRETNAAVRKAYEHYSLMLALANGGRFNAGY